MRTGETGNRLNKDNSYSPGRLRLCITITTPTASFDESQVVSPKSISLPKHQLRRFPAFLPQLVEFERRVPQKPLGESLTRRQEIQRRLSGIPVCPALVRPGHRHLRSISPKVSPSPYRLPPVRVSLLRISQSNRPARLRGSGHRLKTEGSTVQ